MKFQQWNICWVAFVLSLVSKVLYVNAYHNTAFLQSSSKVEVNYYGNFYNNHNHDHCHYDSWSSFHDHHSSNLLWNGCDYSQEHGVPRMASMMSMTTTSVEEDFTSSSSLYRVMVGRDGNGGSSSSSFRNDVNLERMRIPISSVTTRGRKSSIPTRIRRARTNSLPPRRTRTTRTTMSSSIVQRSDHLITNSLPRLQRMLIGPFQKWVQPSSTLSYSYDMAIKALAVTYDSTVKAALLSFLTCGRLLQKTWWFIPMFLAIVPLYSILAHGALVATPDWWKLVCMDPIIQSSNAAVIIPLFLSSNVAYLFSGLYLWNKFNGSNHIVPSCEGLSLPLLMSLPWLSSSLSRWRKKNNARNMGDICPNSDISPLDDSNFSNLGLWLLLSGLVSTIFHSVQSLVSYTIAESLCYMDHAVAISAGCYFFNTCGFPSRKALVVGILALITLCGTGPAYAWLHSTWHFLSAGAAVVWADDAYNQRLIQLIQEEENNYHRN